LPIAPDDELPNADEPISLAFEIKSIMVDRYIYNSSDINIVYSLYNKHLEK
jgi:hypothetical protein